MSAKPKICPNCLAENNPELKECWKCSHSFFEGSILGKLISFGWHVAGWMRLLFWVAAVLFCWGLVSNVILGKMTTGQYVRQIGIDFKQEIMDRLSGPILETMNRLTDISGGLNGPVREYFGNGRLKSEIAYKDGKREGAAKMYYPSGQLKAEGFYENGKLKGLAREYDESGNLKP